MSKPIKELNDKELLEEWYKWEQKIKNATGWSAALVAADEFRTDCQREIDRRNTNARG